MASKLTPDVHRTIVEWLEGGNFFETSAAAAGVRPALAREWLRRGALAEDGPHADFFRDVQKAAATSEGEAVTLLIEAAQNGDTKTIQWWLERRFPERWGLKIRHHVERELSVAVSRVEGLADELGDEIVARVLAALAGADGDGAAAIEETDSIH